LGYGRAATGVLVGQAFFARLILASFAALRRQASVSKVLPNRVNLVSPVGTGEPLKFKRGLKHV
jgi:hypothetical protein